MRRATLRSIGAATSKSRDRLAPEWKVATTGTEAPSVAHIDVLGVSGSWTCTTSGSKRRNVFRTCDMDHGRGSIGAFEAL